MAKRHSTLLSGKEPQTCIRGGAKFLTVSVNLLQEGSIYLLLLQLQ